MSFIITCSVMSSLDVCVIITYNVVSSLHTLTRKEGSSDNATLVPVPTLEDLGVRLVTVHTSYSDNKMLYLIKVP